MKVFERKLEEYAELAVRLGVNVQEGQTLVVDAPTTAADFVRIVAEKAYDAGAKSIHVHWHDPYVEKTRLLRSGMEALSEYPAWKAQGYTEMAQEGAAFLTVLMPRPGLMGDVPAERTTAASRAAQQALKEFREYIQSDKVSWSIVALPTQEWADKVFPGVHPEDRVAKLWESVCRVTRLDQDDPVAAWQKHIRSLQDRLAQLNRARFRRLRYAAPGTDLVIELPEEYVWLGGGGTTENGVFFVPNIPTEECFTAPMRTGVNGVVRSTRPLFHAGKLVEDFWIRFENGRIVEYEAKNGHDVLKSIIETDEGSHYLGEVALVPNSSPISREGVVFYNTLFDENASCHIAIGSAYPVNISDGATLSQEQLLEHGLNMSLVHVDFMVGSSEMDIDAETPDGQWVALFRKGEWAAELSSQEEPR
jgi:aminopeptidase